jgi:hypothetical protein
LKGRRTRFERITVPKNNFGTRPAVVQSPVDRVDYHAVVNAVSRSVAGDLATFVFGWRLNRESPKNGKLLKNQQEWLAFVAQRREAATEHDSLLMTDITNFFGSVNCEAVIEMVYRKMGGGKPSESVEWMLRTFNDLPDRAGIPQRSTASSILANAFLNPVDDILQRYASAVGAAVIRWMDDLWAFGGTHDLLRRLQLDVQDELRNIGLEINLGKTSIAEGDEVAALVGSIDLERDPPVRNVAVSGMPYVPVRDEEDLERQVDLFRSNPEGTDRGVIRYICVRIRDYDRMDLAEQLIEIAARAPQGADHLSRLFGKTGIWRGLAEWYVTLARSPVGITRVPWQIAQLGTMFPSHSIVESVADLFAEALETGASVELMGVAAHRLSKWREADARVLLRAIGSGSDSPLCRRTAALALHGLGESHTRLSRMLGEFEENVVTDALIERYGKRRIPENADFDPR